MLIRRYLIAHFAKSQLWHSSALLFAFFLTEACGLEARTMGWVMAASLGLNGLIDLAVGAHWRDRMTGMDTAVGIQARAAPLTAGFFLLFAATPLVPVEWRLAWALGSLVGFRVTYSLVDVPQNAMVALVTRSADMQCRLLAWRNMASGLASLSVSLLAAPLVIGVHDSGLYLVWTACLSLFAWGAAWRLGATREGGLTPIAPADGGSALDLPFAAILAALAVMIGAGAAFRAMEPYYAASAGQGVGLLVWGAVGSIVSQPLWILCRRRASPVGVLVLAGLVLAFAAAALLSPLRAAPFGVMAVGLGFGIGSGGMWLMLWAAMTARAAHSRATGFVGVFTCVSKLSQGVAMLLLGHVLAVAPYREGLHDPLSAPSLLMMGALAVMAATSLAVASGIHAVRRTASGERSATPRQAVPTGPAPG